MERQVKRAKPSRKNVERTLMGEYLHRWYILLLTILMFYPGYAAEILIYNTILMNGVPPFGAALLGILIGGIISTLPFLILNIVLCVKKKKYYAIVFQVAAMEIVGMAFFIYNQVLLAGI